MHVLSHPISIVYGKVWLQGKGGGKKKKKEAVRAWAVFGRPVG
jgi:hypothetical protein